MRIAFTLFLFLALGAGINAQTTNDILNVLIANKTISQEAADSLRADAAIKQQDTDASRKSFPVTASRAIQFSAYAQIRYQNLDEAGKKDGFDLRKARIDMKGNLTPYLSIRFQPEFADRPKVLDAFAEIKITDYLMITAGQFKIPFSIENLAPDNKYELIDLSQSVEAMVARSKDVIGNQNGRDLGVQIGGTLIKSKNAALLEYRLGVFNGSGIGVADTANEAKDIVGRLILTPIKGLSLGMGYYNGWGRAIKPDVKGKSQVRDRFGFDVAYATTRLLTRFEYIKGHDGKTDRQGWYLQAGYFVIPQKLQVMAKYDTYDPNNSVSDNISTNYVFGANYLINSWSRLQAYYTVREEEGNAVNNNYFSIQYQFGF